MTATTTRPRPKSSTAPAPRPYVKVKTDMLVMAIEVRGWTHSELAVKAKLKSPATISNLTSGYRKTCHRDTAKRLARALKMDGSKLFEVVA